MAIDDAEVAQILRTIRTMESGGVYNESHRTTWGASGAYQFEPGTWQGLLREMGAAASGMPAYAYRASKAQQDAVAGYYVRQILNQHGGQVNLVPVIWYTGHVPASLDYIPNPGAGNRSTVGSYQQRWMDLYKGFGVPTPAAAAAPPAPTAMSTASGPGGGTQTTWTPPPHQPALGSLFHAYYTQNQGAGLPETHATSASLANGLDQAFTTGVLNPDFYSYHNYLSDLAGMGSAAVA